MCYRRTLVPVLPSMPWARPQAAGCAGSRGSDCQDGHRGAEVIAVQGDREGGKSQMHSRTRLALDAVGTPTGCRLRRKPWIRLSGRPSRERSPCGARSGGGEGHRCTLVPVLPSMPWARPQAAGCAGSRGSDCLYLSRKITGFDTSFSELTPKPSYNLGRAFTLLIKCFAALPSSFFLE